MRPGRLERAAVPFGVALLIIGVTRALFPFDGLYGQDAFAYFNFARAIGPHLRFGTPLPDLFWPRGYPATVALLFSVMGERPAAGQIVSALACAWAATATFLLVRALEKDRLESSGGRSPAPLVAGLAVACSGAVLRTSQVVMADGLALGLAATAMLCAVRFANSGRGGWLVACAVAVAWGAVTRWLVGLVALPILACLVAARRAERRPGWRIPWGWVAVAALAGLAVLVPQLLVARAVPQSLGRHEWLERWSAGNMLARAFDTREGHTHYRLPVGLFYFARLGWPDTLFPTVAAFAVVGAWALGRRRRAPEAALLLGWPLVVWFFVSGIPYENPRFLLPTLPAVGALVGLGYARLRESPLAWRRRTAAIVLVASLVLGLPFGLREHARTVARKNADLALVNWVDAHVPPGATLLMSGGTLVFERYGATPVRESYGLAPADVEALLARGSPCFYLEDPDTMRRIWAGLPPQRLFDELARRPGLTPVATFPPYTLYRLGPPG